MASGAGGELEVADVVGGEVSGETEGRLAGKFRADIDKFIIGSILGWVRAHQHDDFRELRQSGI